MALVIGKGLKFYDVPDNVLSKYAVDEGKVEKMKEGVKKFKSEEAEVEGYGYYMGTCYEGSGWYCDWYDAWSEGGS